jgi:hypothetical protein
LTGTNTQPPSTIAIAIAAAADLIRIFILRS